MQRVELNKYCCAVYGCDLCIYQTGELKSKVNGQTGFHWKVQYFWSWRTTNLFRWLICRAQCAWVARRLLYLILTIILWLPWCHKWKMNIKMTRRPIWKDSIFVQKVCQLKFVCRWHIAYRLHFKSMMFKPVIWCLQPRKGWWLVGREEQNRPI